MSDPDAYSDDGDDFDEVDSASRRSNSPTKMTARQRSKGNKDAQDHLLALPNGKPNAYKVSASSSFNRWAREEATCPDRGGTTTATRRDCQTAKAAK